MNPSDTIAAIATAAGHAPRAAVRISGVRTREVLAHLLGEQVPPRRAFRAIARVGSCASGAGEAIALPVLVVRFEGPRSYTGEDAAEIVFAGSPHVAMLMMESILACPCVRQAEPGEFTARAFLAGKLTLSQVEGVGALIASRNEAQLAASRELLSGRAGERYRAAADDLTTLLALVEAGIDFTDQEDVVAIPRERLAGRLGELAAKIGTMLTPVRSHVRTTDPLVVLYGVPNAGKSTLFNALLGRGRSVASDVEGTTRDAIIEPLRLEDEDGAIYTVQLADLPGRSGDWAHDQAELARSMHRVIREVVARADVVLWCDPQGAFESRGTGSPTELNDRAAVLRVRTCSDIPGGAGGDTSVCALTGEHLGDLRRLIAQIAVHAVEAEAGVLVPRHARALATAHQAILACKAMCDGEQGIGLAQPEAAAGLMREALSALGELVGQVSPDDVIGRVFATFCVGK